LVEAPGDASLPEHEAALWPHHTGERVIKAQRRIEDATLALVVAVAISDHTALD
jgi:hypothetical protein